MAPTEYTIEPASIDDVEAVADCWVRLARTQRRHGSIVVPDANRETMRETLAAHAVDDALYVARHESRIVGFASFSIEHGALELDVTRGVLTNLYVEPDTRGRGIGSALLDAVETALADRGVEVVALEVIAANEDARRFYRRAGYEPHRVSMHRALDEVENDTHSKEGP